jgi:quinol monooxygenase YgiN
MRLLFRLMLSVAALLLVAAPAARAQAPSAQAPSAQAPSAQNPGASTAYVLRFFEVAPGAQKQGADLLKPLAEASRMEAGVMRFDILQRTAPANQFLIFETWKDQQALDAHMAAAHTKQFLDAVAPLLLAPIDDRPCIASNVAPAPAPEGRVLYAVTHVDVGPPNREKAIELLKSAAEATRMENGNLGFDALQQSARTNHFEVVEVWKGRKTEDAHEIAPATKDFRAKLAPMIGARYDRRWYRPL